MYKITRPNGFDFYSGTINYRDNIGRIVWVEDFDPPEIGPSGKGLHASKNPNDCFVGAKKIPCSAFRVQGRKFLAGNNQISRYQGLRVIEEIYDLDKFFGWKYGEAISPIHPFRIAPPKIEDAHITILKEWSSVWNATGQSVCISVRKSIQNLGSCLTPVMRFVWNSVGDSVWSTIAHTIGDYAWTANWRSPQDNKWNSVWNATRNAVWTEGWNNTLGSVRDSIWAYIGSLFPNIEKWGYIDNDKGTYPYHACVDLWKVGLVSSFDREMGIWRLHGGDKAEILWEGKTA